LRIITKTGKVATMPLPKSIKKRLRRKVYKTVGSDMLVVERLQETFKRVVTDDIQADAATLQLPVLLIYGEDDLATPPQYGRILRNLINRSKFEIIPNAGHFAHLDQPNEVTKKVGGFLA
jgi:pimeloyl-ACP methyl ester carboxylesterase